MSGGGMFFGRRTVALLVGMLSLAAYVSGAGMDMAEEVDQALVDENLDLAENKAFQLLPDRFANRFTSGFISAFLLIIVSEIGDKTFFIAAVLAMKRGGMVVFCGASAALAVMTVLSALAGKALPSIVDPHWTHIASIAVFVVFGVKLLWEGHNMPSNSAAAQDELIDEVAREIELREGGTSNEDNLERGQHQVTVISGGSESGRHGNGGSGNGHYYAASGGGRRAEAGRDGDSYEAGQAGQGNLGNVGNQRNVNEDERSRRWPQLAKYAWGRVPSPVRKAGKSLKRLTRPSSSAFTETFVMTFAAEWGDRSQIATLALGASKDIYGVNLGAVLGHMACTLTAVSGARALAGKLSEKSVTLAGGTLFLAFALAGYFLEM